MTELFFNGSVLHHADGAFRLGTDTMLLAHFAASVCGRRVVDLGAGCGTLGLLLCACNDRCHITGIELEAAAHALALENIRVNALESRLTALHGDVREIKMLLPSAAFDTVVSNPPYFPVGSGHAGVSASARTELNLTLDQLCRAAAWLLPSGGRFIFVHRPERLCDIFCALRENGLEPKRLQFVRHTAQAAVCLVLIEARCGGHPGIRYEPDLIEFHSDGTESAAYRDAYHRGEAQ